MVVFIATLDTEEAYSNVEFVVIADSTNHDGKKNYFDTPAVEAAHTFAELLQEGAIKEEIDTLIACKLL